MIRVRFWASSGAKIAGSRFLVDVPTVSAAKSMADRPTPIAVFRPSRATAIPTKAICDEMRTSFVLIRNCQPRMSSAPARPAKRPEIAIARK